MKATSRRRQHGQSLIGMMVGLLISLLTIGAMLVIYKNMISMSGDASRAAQRDGQVASALLAAQIDMQQAGFGITADSALESRLAVSLEGRQVTWRFKPERDQSDQCAGLRLVDEASSTLPRGLYRLPAKACSSALGSSWNDSQLQPLAADIAFFEPLSKDGTAYTGSERELGALTLQAAPDQEGYRFHAAADACLPFQQQQDLPPSGQRITLRQTSDDVLFSVCLPNLAPAPST